MLRKKWLCKISYISLPLWRLSTMLLLLIRFVWISISNFFANYSFIHRAGVWKSTKMEAAALIVMAFIIDWLWLHFTIISRNNHEWPTNYYISLPSLNWIVLWFVRFVHFPKQSKPTKKNRRRRKKKLIDDASNRRLLAFDPWNR